MPQGIILVFSIVISELDVVSSVLARITVQVSTGISQAEEYANLSAILKEPPRYNGLQFRQHAKMIGSLLSRNDSCRDNLQHSRIKTLFLCSVAQIANS
jgi:argininosuccinate lyase